ncbi:MAG: putative phosphoribosyl transferase [Chloroflexota bacterium]|jgi:predicted phosphoribosyltransferase|nr:putative phosphoribosyl transferase [Chloroflexota bacterium]
MTFADRIAAGRLLGERLRELGLDDPVVLGLPRGGVIVAAEVAAALDAPLDIVVARKLGVPWQPELAFGAVAPGTVVLQRDVLDGIGLRRGDVDAAIAEQTAQLAPLAARYRSGRAQIPLLGRTAVIVDDGLATGATATAAVRSIRGHGPARIVLAVPVGAAQTVAALGREADQVVCLEARSVFRAVGLHYDDFATTRDEEVIERLAARQSERA